MGVGRSVLRRAVQAPIVERGNLEKVLENAPKLAPKHESTKELLEKSKTDNQASFQRYNKKNEKYLNLLKSIRVVDTIDIKETEQQKDVPSEESSKKTGSLKSGQLVLLFQQRMTNPEEWDEQKITTFFKLPPESAKNLMKYYSDFNVQTAPQLPEPLEDITV